MVGDTGTMSFNRAFHAILKIYYFVELTLPIGLTLVPILIASDVTHLTNFSGDGKLCPVYISISNIPSSIRVKPTSHTWILIALLSIEPKRLYKQPRWLAKK